MEKISERSYVMSIEEFLDMFETSKTKEEIMKIKEMDAPLNLTSGQFAMVAQALIVHNIMMDTIDQQEAEMLLRFSNILEVALVEKFADKKEMLKRTFTSGKTHAKHTKKEREEK